MVRYWKYTKAFFRLVRIQNLLIIASTMYLLRQLIFIPLLSETAFQPQISGKLFFLLVLSTVFLAAAGYVINDYFDRKADLINRPGKVILGRILRRRAGMFWHVVLNVVGIALGVFVSYKLGLLKFSIVFVIISGLLWFYSTTYKRQVLLGNIVVAFMVAAVPLIILLFELPLLIAKYRYYLISDSTNIDYLSAWIVGYSVFAFLLTLIREIVKDLEDFKGDFAFGRQTIPIAWGSAIAKKIVLALAIVSIILIVYFLVSFFSDIISVIYISVSLLLPFAYFIYLVYKSSSNPQYHKISTLLKLIMLGGIGYAVIAYYFVF